MTLVDKHLLNAALAERDAAREENARLRAAVEDYLDGIPIWGPHPDDGRMYLDVPHDDFLHDIRQALAVPTADDGAERGAR